MRADIVPRAKFPDYELTDHARTRRKLSELQGNDPIYKIYNGYWFWGRPSPEDRTPVHFTFSLKDEKSQSDDGLAIFIQHFSLV